jgi:hypothetical protein
MGKRELILILAFGLLGATVYFLTAPPPVPGEQGFSVSRMIEGVRREVSGNQASAETTRSTSAPVPDTVTELRVHVLRGPITIVGEGRDTVEADLHVRSTGYDPAEAAELANQTVLVFDRVGSLLMARVEYPTGGRPTATLALKVPARLRVRIEGTTSQLEVSGVAALEVAQSQGETTLRDIPGRVTATHRGGRLLVADAGSLKLNARGSTTTIEKIRGETEISTQGGELKASALGGPLDLNGNGTRLEVETLEPAAGPARIVVVSGRLTMTGAGRETRIDLRNARLDLHLDQPAEVSVFSEGREPIEVRAPTGGFRLDAQSREGRITGTPSDLFATWDAIVETPAEGNGQRLTGSIRGGGPLLTIRAHRDITFAAK